MLLLLKTTQLWLNIYENYFLMPEMFKLYNPQIEMFARFKMKSSFHKTKRII